MASYRHMYTGQSRSQATYLLLECVIILLGGFKGVLQIMELQSQLLHQLSLSLQVLILGRGGKREGEGRGGGRERGRREEGGRRNGGRRNGGRRERGGKRE